VDGQAYTGAAGAAVISPAGDGRAIFAVGAGTFNSRHYIGRAN
jgi:hypothetical protein